jgi:uncharacterized protein YcbX
VTRVGLTPVKGGRHVARPDVELGPHGAVGDRMLCLVDPTSDKVLRTVRHPELLRTVPTLSGDRLAVELDGATVSATLPGTGEPRKVDYWGRQVEVELLDGPWADLYSRLTGEQVALARVLEPAGVVFGGGVSLVLTSSLHALSARVGAPVAGERFRPTFVVDSGDAPPGCEAAWVGREVAVGEAVLRIRGAVPRCAVVDLDPVSGRADLPVLKTLSGYGRSDGEPRFGVDADVVRPGHVATGDDLVRGRS